MCTAPDTTTDPIDVLAHLSSGPSFSVQPGQPTAAAPPSGLAAGLEAITGLATTLDTIFGDTEASVAVDFAKLNTRFARNRRRGAREARVQGNEDFGLQLGQELARMRAAAGASGFDVNDEGIVDTIGTAAELGALAANRIDHNAALAVWATDVELAQAQYDQEVAEYRREREQLAAIGDLAGLLGGLLG